MNLCYRYSLHEQYKHIDAIQTFRTSSYSIYTVVILNQYLENYVGYQMFDQKEKLITGCGIIVKQYGHK